MITISRSHHAIRSLTFSICALLPFGLMPGQTVRLQEQYGHSAGPDESFLYQLVDGDVSANGQIVVTTGLDLTLRVWHLPTRSLLRVIPTRPKLDEANMDASAVVQPSVALSPDGLHYVLRGQAPGSLKGRVMVGRTDSDSPPTLVGEVSSAPGPLEDGEDSDSGRRLAFGGCPDSAVIVSEPPDEWRETTEVFRIYPARRTMERLAVFPYTSRVLAIWRRPDCTKVRLLLHQEGSDEFEIIELRGSGSTPFLISRFQGRGTKELTQWHYSTDGEFLWRLTPEQASRLAVSDPAKAPKIVDPGATSETAIRKGCDILLPIPDKPTGL